MTRSASAPSKRPGEFLDTNVFIRLLARDDPQKTQACLAYFQKVRSGRRIATTSESVIAEIVYVLSSPVLYRLGRSEVARVLRPLLELRSLRIEHKRSVLRALELYERTALDFEDCLSVEHVQRGKLAAIVSYDKDFDRVGLVQRREP